MRPHEFNQSNLRFLVKDTLLNNSQLTRFNIVCTPFPMERHICHVPLYFKYKWYFVQVSNKGESFEMRLYLRIPWNVSYQNHKFYSQKVSHIVLFQ